MPQKQPSLDATAKIVGRFLQLDPSQLWEHFFPADEQYLDQIIAIRQAFVDRAPQQDCDYLRWRYQWNSRTQHQSKWADNRIWVFVINNKVLGFIGVEVVKLSVKAETHTCLKVMDVAVLPEYESKALGVWMNLVILDAGLPVLCLGSNQNSLGLLTRLFHRMPDRKVYKSILRGQQYFKGKIHLAYVANIISILYNTLFIFSLRLYQLFIGRGISIMPLDNFGATESRLHANQTNKSISLIHDADYLNWRTFQAPGITPIAYEILKNNQTIGFIVATIFEKKKNAHLIDWAIHSGKNATKDLAAALVCLQIYLFRQHLNFIAALSYDQASDTAFRKAWIRLRKDDSKTFFVFSADSQFMKSLQNKNAWFLTGSDADDF